MCREQITAGLLRSKFVLTLQALQQNQTRPCRVWVQGFKIWQGGGQQRIKTLAPAKLQTPIQPSVFSLASRFFR
jgi:hypothetical protein